MKTQTRIGLAMALTLALLAGLAPRAGAADYKLQLAFTNYTRAEVLTNFPVLVTFSNGLYGTFDYETFTAPASGGDLRFMDSTESTYLDFEIEKWESSGASYVWVRVPQLSSNTVIYAKWGGSDTNLPACTTNGTVWADGYGGVWHLSEPTGITHNDSAGVNNWVTNISGVGYASAGRVAGAVSVSGGASGMTGPDHNELDGMDTKLTVEGWGYATNIGVGLGMVSKRAASGSLEAHSFFMSNTSVPTADIGTGGRIASGGTITLNRWSHLAMVFDPSTSKRRFYIDGLLVGEPTETMASVPNTASPFFIGVLGGNATTGWHGWLDEIRVSSVARSSNWVWATYANTASNALFNGYGTVIAPATATAPPQIQNQAPTGVATNGATFNARLVTNGFENAAVYVAWGQTNGVWTTNGWAAGAWTNGSYPATNLTLEANANYYYRFGATNSTTNVMASGYQYLITGEVTVQPTDPLGRTNASDTAAFTVYRPASCTNDALTVAYTLGGTATNGTHYTNAPAASGTNGTVTIPAGQTNAVITVYPLSVIVPEQTVVLTLVSSNYPVGAVNSATCTLAAVSLTLGANAYLNGSGQLISDSGAAVLLTKTSGAGSLGDPYVFDVPANLNMGSYTIRGNSTHALAPYSATWRVTGNVTGTGNFDSHTTLNGASGGHVWIEAGGSIAINRVGTYVSYNAHGGNVYLWATGTVTVASWIDTRSDAGEAYDAGSVTIRSEGPVAGQGIAINGNTDGYSIRAHAYLTTNAGRNGGTVALYCQTNITLASGINTGPGKGTGGSVMIRGDLNDSGLRAGVVSIGGANGLRTGATLGNSTSGNVTIRATSLQLTGKIDTTQNAYYGGTGNVDIDVLENATIGGFIDTRLLGSLDGSPGFVKIVARRTRVEGVDASGFSIRTWPGGTGETRNSAAGDADVTLTGVDTSAELYDTDNPTNSMTSSIYVAGKIDTGRWYSDNALGSIRITAVEVQLGSNVTHATLPAATGATPTLAIRYGVTTYGVVTHLKENGVYWNGSGGHNITYTTDRGAYTFTADVPYAGKTGGAVPANIQNRAPSGVATAAATFNGYLVTNGTGNALVYVVWGQTNGAVSGSWAYTNAWTAGAWTNGSYPSTNMTLEPNTDYYYTFVASNAFGPVVATGAQYLITGELTVQATEPTGRVNAADTAAFTVYRPASCTNEDLVVNYSLDGSAASPADYTIAPVSGAVVIAKGQTNGVITVTPVFQQSLEQNVILTLEPGRYAIGSPDTATCTLAAVAGTNRFWVASGPGNWNDAANWSFASGGPAGYSAPGSASMATFDGNGAGDCAINATVNVAGLQIASGYGGVISQGVYTVTVGTNGWTQAGGTFAGYTTDATKGITLGGNFNLSGGTFTSPAGTLLLYRSDAASSFTHSGGTFNHGNGTVEFKHGQGWGITVSAPATTFHNLTVNGARQNSGQAMTIGSGNVLTVNNTFTYTAWDAFAGMSCEMNGGTIDVKGDFVIGNASVRHAGTTIVQLSSSGAQSIAGGAANVWLPILAINKPAGEVTVTGTLYAGEFRLISGTFRSTSGTFYVGASDIYVDGTGNWTHTAGGTFEHNNGSVVIRNGIYFNTTHAINVMATETFYNLTIQGARGTDTSLSGDTLVVLGKLSTGMWDNGSSSGNNINNGAIQVHGDVEVSESFNNGGTATVTLTGGNDQSIRVNAGKPIGGTWTIDKSGGTVTLASAVSLSTAGQDLIWTSGGLDLSSYTLTVADDVTIAAGATTLGVTVAGAAPSNGRLTCTDVLTGIANAGLAVTVTATEAQVLGQTYTILINNSTLSPNQFAPVTWLGSWKGVVDYAANSGKNVTLSGIYKEQGSVFRFR